MNTTCPIHVQDYTLESFKVTKRLCEGRKGFTAMLEPGDYVIVPNMWWHAAYNHEETFSVNNQVVTIWNIPTAILETFTMHRDWTMQQYGKEMSYDLSFYKGSFNIGETVTAWISPLGSVALPLRDSPLPARTTPLP
jgi:hypothetical protein